MTEKALLCNISKINDQVRGGDKNALLNGEFQAKSGNLILWGPPEIAPVVTGLLVYRAGPDAQKPTRVSPFIPLLTEPSLCTRQCDLMGSAADLG